MNAVRMADAMYVLKDVAPGARVYVDSDATLMAWVRKPVPPGDVQSLQSIGWELMPSRPLLDHERFMLFIGGE